MVMTTGAMDSQPSQLPGSVVDDNEQITISKALYKELLACRKLVNQFGLTLPKEDPQNERTE